MNTKQIMKAAVQFAEQFAKATPESFSNTYEVLNSAIEALVQERDAAQADALEQARLCGMGGEREADLLGKVARLERERDALQLVERGMQSVIDELKTENAQIRELMNCYNLGGWMDSLRIIKERDALSKLADKWNLECDDLREDNKRLAAEVKTLREAMYDVIHGLEGARIWGGMEWTYNPLHPIKYLPLRDKARTAIKWSDHEPN